MARVTQQTLDETEGQNFNYVQLMKYQQLVAEGEKKLAAENIKDEKKRQEMLTKIKLDAILAASKYEENVRKNGNAAALKEYRNLKKQEMSIQKEAMQEELDNRLAAIEESSMSEQEKLRAIAEERNAHALATSKLMQENNDALIENIKAERDKALQETSTGIGTKIANFEDQLNDKIDINREALDAYDDIYKDLSKQMVENQALLESGDLSPEERASLEIQQEQLKEAQRSVALEKNSLTVAQAGNVLLAQALDDYKKAYDSAENFLMQSAAKIDARLQGSNESFRKLTNKVTGTLAINPYVQSTKVLDEVNKAVEQGIAYNIEQRAFLAGVSDKIATTFNAFDSNLLRIVKLQQADSTAARMGMEAYLTKFLNSTFKDTSYLNDGFDTITGKILDASAQLNYKQAAEFEFVVQKWMGSLSSLGVSSSALESIAEGINLLGTGDVSAIANNSQLQTLLVQSANMAGLEYSELLLNGINAKDTNKLLKSMVEYLGSIAKNTDNQVVRAAYKDVLGIGVTDLKAIAGLTQNELANISGMNMSYGQMQGETSKQVATMITRVTLPEMLDNVYNNVLYSVASDMANDPIMWSMSKMIDFMDQNKLDINIPSIGVMGNFFDFNTSVVGLMKAATGIGKGLSFASNLLQGLGSLGGLSLAPWGAEETLVRGNTAGFGLTSTFGGTSSSASYITNNNTQDITHSTIAESATSGEELVKGVETEDQKKAKEKTLADVYNLFDPIITKNKYMHSLIFAVEPLPVTNDILTAASKNDKQLYIKHRELESAISNNALNINSLTLDTLSANISNHIDETSGFKVSNDTFSNLSSLTNLSTMVTSLGTIASKPDPSSTVSVGNKPYVQQSGDWKVKITNASDIKSSLTLSKDSKIEIDGEAIKKAFIDAMADENLSRSLKSIFFNNGSIDVWVANEVEVSNNNPTNSNKNYIF